MPAATYTFEWEGISQEFINQNMSPSCTTTLAPTNPLVTMQVTIDPDDPSNLQDLIGCMAQRGWVLQP